MPRRDGSDVLALTIKVRQLCAEAKIVGVNEDALLEMCVAAEAELAQLTVLMSALNDRVKEMHHAAR